MSQLYSLNMLQAILVEKETQLAALQVCIHHIQTQETTHEIRRAMPVLQEMIEELEMQIANAERMYTEVIKPGG